MNKNKLVLLSSLFVFLFLISYASAQSNQSVNASNSISESQKQLDLLVSRNISVDRVNESIDSLSVKLRKEIKIEGLKSEKRAIQASDRKILDVNRQTEIDQEISKLDK